MRKKLKFIRPSYVTIKITVQFNARVSKQQASKQAHKKQL